MALVASFLRSFLYAEVRNDDGESAPLLNEGPSNSATTDDYVAKSNYGAIAEGEVSGDDDQKAEETPVQFNEQKSPKLESMSWIPYLRRFAILFPIIWPTNSWKLQLHILGSFICEVASRSFIIIAPFKLGTLIDALGNGSGRLPVYELFMYIFFEWIAGCEILETIRLLLWVPVEENAKKSGSLLVYNHVMKMSGDFHDNKQLAELYEVIEQGNGIHNLLDTVLFSVVPMLIDPLVACAYLTHVFGIQMSAVAFMTTIAYLSTCRYFLKKDIGISRALFEANVREYQVIRDSLGCWRTVAYFNNFGHELNRYDEAVDHFSKLSRKSELWNTLAMNAYRIVLTVGYAGALLIASYQVSHGTIDVSTFVVLLSYWDRFVGERFDTTP